MEQKIFLYDAIAEMRKLSQKKQDFSFAFMSFQIDRQKSNGLVEVPRARLRAATPDSDNQYSDYMLNYTDLDTGMPGRCWQPCLMYFNGQKIEI